MPNYSGTRVNDQYKHQHAQENVPLKKIDRSKTLTSVRIS